VYGGTSLPGLFSLARLLRCIVLREGITLVHGHAAFRRGGNGNGRGVAAAQRTQNQR
jgi:hypothetical protein